MNSFKINLLIFIPRTLSVINCLDLLLISMTMVEKNIKHDNTIAKKAKK